MTFAIITPASIVGAYVERVGFGFVLLFSALWMILVHAPVTHWIWGATREKLMIRLMSLQCTVSAGSSAR